jgi:hypothetical protein
LYCLARTNNDRKSLFIISTATLQVVMPSPGLQNIVQSPPLATRARRRRPRPYPSPSHDSKFFLNKKCQAISSGEPTAVCSMVLVLVTVRSESLTTVTGGPGDPGRAAAAASGPPAGRDDSDDSDPPGPPRGKIGLTTGTTQIPAICQRVDFTLDTSVSLLDS